MSCTVTLAHPITVTIRRSMDYGEWMVRAMYIDICGTDLPEKGCDGYRAGSESCHLLVPGSDDMKIL